MFQQLLVIGKFDAVAIAASLFTNWFWHIITSTSSARHSYSHETCEDLFGSGEPVVQVSTLTFHLVVLGTAQVLCGSKQDLGSLIRIAKEQENRKLVTF